MQTVRRWFQSLIGNVMERCGAVLDEMVAVLEAMGIPVETYHAEGGRGQFELVTEYADALQVHHSA